jgi:hypothetical protein
LKTPSQVPGAYQRLSDAQVAVKFRQRIVRQYFVRFHMGLILSATTASGLIFSKLLLLAGLTSIPVRYPLAVILAYLVFVGMMRMWVGYVLIDKPARRRSGSGWDLSSVDLPDFGGAPTGGNSGSSFAFGGGDSGGGGASDAWGVGDAIPSGGSSSGGGSSFPSLDLDIDLDDGIGILLVLAALVLAIFGAGGYLIYAAPEILPDIAFNALLAGCLTGAVKRAETKGWVHSVFRSTWIPLTLVLLMTIGLAVVIHRHCPGAPKLMDALGCAAAIK